MKAAILLFAALPVLHNGRVKPVDTVARSSLLMFSGKQTVKTEEKRLSATEWLLDVLFVPEKADRYKVFMVNDADVQALLGRGEKDGRFLSFTDLSPHIEEIRRQAEQAHRLEAPQRNRFQTAVVNLESRLTLYQRLKNTIQVEDTEDYTLELAVFSDSLLPGVRAVQAHMKGGKGDERALSRLAVFFERYKFLARAAAFRPLPPESGDDWLSMGDGLLEGLKSGRPHPAIRGLAFLSRDWRRGDEAAFAQAVSDTAKAVELRAPASVTRARWEVRFNRIQLFYWGILLYFLAAALALWRPKWAFALLGATFALHTVGLLARMWLEGRPPVTNLYSSAIFIGWFAVLLSLLLRKPFATLGGAAIGSITLIIAHNLTGSGDTMEMMRAVLDSNFWLGTHVVTVTIGYAATFLAGILAHVWILKRSPEKDLPKAVYGVVCFALFFSFVGTVLGGIWADQSWGRFWGWDPKENGAFLIVLWNAIILHCRWAGFIRDRGLMIMAVFGNIVTALSWFGVNMLGIGLHSYGFMDKAFWALALFCATQLSLMSWAASRK